MSQTAEQKKASFSEKEFLSKATPMMRSVYERWGGNPVVAEDLRKAVQNREKVMEFWRRKHEGVEAELAPYAERLADALVSAYKAGGLAAAKRAAFEFFDREKYGERKLVDRLLPDASEALQHERGAMLKFSRLPLFTCPGADVCGAHCYAIHGHYANEPVKDAILRQDAFIQLLEKKLIERVGRAFFSVSPSLRQYISDETVIAAVAWAGGQELAPYLVGGTHHHVRGGRTPYQSYRRLIARAHYEFARALCREGMCLRRYLIRYLASNIYNGLAWLL